MSEINLGLASGDVLPDDQYWVKGMPRWERVSSLPGVIIPTLLKTYSSTASVRPSRPPIVVGGASDATAASENLSFWSRPDAKPRLAVWSPSMYLLLSFFFTPLMGTIMIAQNHSATQETTWRGIAWFWLMVWGGFVVAAITLHFAATPYAAPMYWIIGYATLVVGWTFTCAMPHRRFLTARTFEAAWRVDWGKPVGFGLLAWMVVFTVYLLTR